MARCAQIWNWYRMRWILSTSRSFKTGLRTFRTLRVAVYVGALHVDRLDVDLVIDLAGSIPNLEIVLVGPNSLGVGSDRRLKGVPNVTLLGPRTYAVVPAYLQHADVVIVPHIVSPFTDSLDPIKAYECLAVGRPTIATPVAGFRGLPSPVVVAQREGFVAEVAKTLAGDDTVVNSVVPSWTERAVAFAGALRRARRREGSTSPGLTRDAELTKCGLFAGCRRYFECVGFTSGRRRSFDVYPRNACKPSSLCGCHVFGYRSERRIRRVATGRAASASSEFLWHSEKAASPQTCCRGFVNPWSRRRFADLFWDPNDYYCSRPCRV